MVSVGCSNLQILKCCSDQGVLIIEAKPEFFYQLVWDTLQPNQPDSLSSYAASPHGVSKSMHNQQSENMVSLSFGTD
jgi:hypothetical protein